MNTPPPWKRPICPTCHVRWRQIGNRTGHCSGCHRTFSGITTFDAHRRTTDHGVVCVDPAELRTKAGEPRFRTYVDPEGSDVWRSAVKFPRDGRGVVNLTETAKILTLAAEYERTDTSKVTETTVRAWQSVLTDINVQEAADAVTGHYQDSTWPVKVADIRDRVKLARRAAAEAAYQARSRAEVTPGDPYPVQAGVTEVVRALAEHQGRDPVQADVDLQARRRDLSVPCPWCNAVAWDPCVIPGVMDAKGSPQQLKRRPAHPSRVEAAS